MPWRGRPLRRGRRLGGCVGLWYRHHDGQLVKVETRILLDGGAYAPTSSAVITNASCFAVGFKNLMFSEGYDDYSSAVCRVADGVATVTCACAGVGQGFVTLAQQITRTKLEADEVILPRLAPCRPDIALG